ncbi:pyridoxal phosphate homeostasis protein-like [Watersipora subatra]|uniref:pyridoxal phosphate homeostasis protein-like n=1 Tax=Watersipora subatra TaxID=2589382 RepID=UPI00355B048A
MNCLATIRKVMTSSNGTNGLLLSNIASVNAKVKEALSKRLVPNNLTRVPRLVCVGKTKPSSAIETVYSEGQRHFGENYVNEIAEKSVTLQTSCPEIKWHFIGHLQSKNVRKLLECPNLDMIETIDSEKIADRVNKVWGALGKANSPLKVMVQINTSNEPQKYGVAPGDTCKLVEYIREKCPNLAFCGIMTIGSFSHDYSQGPNPDFLKLLECKKDVMEQFSLQEDEVEVSMGMSNDFEHAIELGSTNVRVGSTIFGAREYAASAT